MNELRLTDTNAADDSAGSVWGLDGNLFMPVVASAAISIGVILILFSLLHVVMVVELSARGGALRRNPLLRPAFQAGQTARLRPGPF